MQLLIGNAENASWGNHFLFSKEFSKSLKTAALLKKNKKIKTLKPLRLKGFSWSCYPDSNWGPHPYQFFNGFFLLLWLIVTCLFCPLNANG